MKRAFTLAEVLITLGIIGVVAAMTMPTVINSTQKKVLETQYKKAMSVYANALQMAMAKNNTPGDLVSTQLFGCYGLSSDQEKATCFKDSNKDLFNIIEDSESEAFKNKLQSIKYKSSYEDMFGFIFPPAYAGMVHTDYIWQDALYSFATNDGMIFGYTWMTTFDNVNGNFVTTGYSVIVDVNGPKNPNKWASDMYMFEVDKKGKLVDATYF